MIQEVCFSHSQASRSNLTQLRTCARYVHFFMYVQPAHHYFVLTDRQECAIREICTIGKFLTTYFFVYI